MDRSWGWKVAMVVGVTLASLWLLVPTYYSFKMPREQRNDLNALQAALPAWAPDAKYRLNLGLDLQGGIHMVMRVDTRTALQKRTDRRGMTMVNYLKEQKVGGDVKYTSDPEKLQVTLTVPEASQVEAVKNEVEKNFGDFSHAATNGGDVVFALREGSVSQFRTDALDQALLTIRKRIDKWGVAEADIRKQGADSIVISLPGRSDPEKAKELVGTTAQLEFRMVDDTVAFFEDVYKSVPPAAESGITLVTDEGFPQLQAKDRQVLVDYVKNSGKVPAEREVLLECREGAKKGTCDAYRTYYLEKTVPLTGDSLAGADASLGQYNEAEVNFTFDAQGGKDFGT